MVSKIEPDRYADTGFSVADTPSKLNAFLFEQMMKKSGYPNASSSAAT